jgi:hypothetical protein
MVYGDTNDHLLAELDRIARALDGYRGTLEGDAGHSQPVDSDAASPPAPATLSLSLPPDTRGDVEARAERIANQVGETPPDTVLRLRHSSRRSDCPNSTVGVGRSRGRP